jgi:hypothetical protein
MRRNSQFFVSGLPRTTITAPGLNGAERRVLGNLANSYNTGRISPRLIPGFPQSLSEFRTRIAFESDGKCTNRSGCVGLTA